MIVSKYISEPIDATAFANAPNPDKGIIKRFKADGLELRVHSNAEAIGFSSTAVIPFAITCISREGEYIYSASIERLDIRILSSMLGIPVKTLQEEEGIKGFLGEPHIVMYGDGKREDLGPYTMNLDEAELTKELLDFAIDSLDLIDEPQEIV